MHTLIFPWIYFWCRVWGMEPVGCVNFISGLFLVNFIFGLFLAMHCLNMCLFCCTYQSANSEARTCWLYLVPFMTWLFLVLILSSFGFIHSFYHFRVGSSPTTEESLTAAFQKTKSLSRAKKKTTCLETRKRSSKEKKWWWDHQMAKPREPSLPDTQMRGFQHMNIHAPNYQGLRGTRTCVKTLAENPCVVKVNCASKNVEIPLGGD